MVAKKSSGQRWRETALNASEIGRSMGLADTTVRGYLDRLSDAFIMRQLQPWYENLTKRQVRAPKIYVRDSGLLHALLDIRSARQLDAHPRLGTSWEGFVIDQVIQALRAASQECFFWRTHTGAELDLLVVRGKRRIGVEVKRTTAPAITPSMRIALADLKLTEFHLVHAGNTTFQLPERFRPSRSRVFSGHSNRCAKAGSRRLPKSGLLLSRRQKISSPCSQYWRP